MAKHYTHPSLKNLADDLTDKERAEIASRVLETYASDQQSRLGWLAMNSEWVKLYFLRDTPANPPWPGSSAEGIPILAEAANQFSARAYKAMFPSKTFIKAVPIGKPDAKAKERAERVSYHMSWQLTARDNSYVRNKSRMLHSLPLHGSFFTKTYYSPYKKGPVIENVRPVDLVVPYGIGQRDIEDIERKTHIIFLSLNKCRVMTEDGYFSGDSIPIGLGEVEWNPVTKAHDDAHKIVHGTDFRDDPDAVCLKLEQHLILDLDGDGIAEPYIATVDYQSRELNRLSIRYDTDELGQPTNNKEPIEYFTHYQFLDNPDGFYGLGFGHLLGPVNTAVNKILRQTIDAATLANVGNMSGFVSKMLAMPKDELVISLGEFTVINATADDIKNGIFQFQFPGPQPVLRDVIELLTNRADRLATVTEAVTGQTDKVQQPTALLALIEQSLQVFTSIYDRLILSLGDELRKVYDINRKFMDPEEYFSVQDDDGTVIGKNASRDDYSPDLQIQPIADPQMSTERQKLAKAEAEWNFLSQNQLVMSSPVHFLNASKRYLKAIGSESIDEVLPSFDQGGEGMRVDDPAKEGMLLVFGEAPPRVFPEQDHMAHIKMHQELLDGLTGLSEEQISKIRRHLESHKQIAFFAQALGATRPATAQRSPASGPAKPQTATASFEPQQELDAAGMAGGGEPLAGQSGGQ